MEICGKSDCDKNDICEEQINLPNSEGVSRLNKLRIHRSKMANWFYSNSAFLSTSIDTKNIFYFPEK